MCLQEQSKPVFVGLTFPLVTDSQMLVFLLLSLVFSDFWRRRFYIAVFEMSVSVKQGDKYQGANELPD